MGSGVHLDLVKHLGIVRYNPFEGVCDTVLGINELEFQQRRFPDQIDSPLGILYARQLHQYPVFSLWKDIRLTYTELINTVTDRLQRLVNRQSLDVPRFFFFKHEPESRFVVICFP